MSPQTIQMPQDPSGWGPMLSGGIESLGQVLLMKKKKEEEANKMLLSLLMEYGGQVGPEQMGQMEKTMGFGPSPMGKIGTALGITPEPAPSPLRGIFEPMETGFRMKGKEERGLETHRKKLEIEQPFEIGKEKRGEEKEKRMGLFRTDEEIRGELLKIDKLSGPQRQVKLDDIRASAGINEEMENKYFLPKLERLKQEKIATGDIAGAQAIDLLKKELPLRWIETKKEIELKGVEARKTEQIKLQKEVGKEEIAAKKEKKADYQKTKALLKVTDPRKLEGEEVTEDEINQIRRVVAMQGFDIEEIPVSKKFAGVDWLSKDKFTFRIIDPETGKPPKVYGEKEKITPSIVKPTYRYNQATGKLEVVK